MSEQQITSPEELDALPVGSVVRWVHNGCIWERWPLGWMTTGNAGKCQSEHVGGFPAVLIYHPDAADADPRPMPTEAEVAEAIKSGWFEGMDEFGKYGPRFDPLSAARAVLALFEGVGHRKDGTVTDHNERLAAQPTVAQVQGATYDTAFVRRCATDETYNGELLSARDFDRWLAQVKAEAWAEGYSTGVHDERTAAEVAWPEYREPGRVNPYRTERRDHA